MSFDLECKNCKHYLVCFIRLVINRFNADFEDLSVSFKHGECIYKNEDLDYESLMRLEYVKKQQKKGKE